MVTRRLEATEKGSDLLEFVELAVLDRSRILFIWSSVRQLMVFQAFSQLAHGSSEAMDLKRKKKQMAMTTL